MIYATYVPSNDTWLGLVGMLQRADGDWAFPTISVTAERLTVVDYATVTTVPLSSIWETNSFKKNVSLQLPYAHDSVAVTFLAWPPSKLEEWLLVVYPFDKLV